MRSEQKDLPGRLRTSWGVCTGAGAVLGGSGDFIVIGGAGAATIRFLVPFRAIPEVVLTADGSYFAGFLASPTVEAFQIYTTQTANGSAQPANFRFQAMGLAR